MAHIICLQEVSGKWFQQAYTAFGIEWYKHVGKVVPNRAKSSPRRFRVRGPMKNVSLRLLAMCKIVQMLAFFIVKLNMAYSDEATDGRLKLLAPV